MVHGLEHGQGAAHTQLETICGGPWPMVQSVPGPTPGQALPMKLPVCETHKEERRQAWPKQTDNRRSVLTEFSNEIIEPEKDIQDQEAGSIETKILTE